MEEFDTDSRPRELRCAQSICQTMTVWPISTVLPARSDSDVMFCLQSYLGLIIYIALVY